MAENKTTNVENSSNNNYLAPNFDIESFKDSTLEKFERNKNVIYGGLALLIISVVGIYYYFGVHRPAKAKEASEAIFMAQFALERDSFELALAGRHLPGQPEVMGFLDIIDNYGGDAANVARYGAGISLLHLGKYDEAVEQLQAYNGADGLTQAMAYGAIGDAKSEQNKMDEALSYYQKAADYQANAATSPYFLRKAALLSEMQGKKEEAKNFLQKAISNYPEAAKNMNLEADLIRVTGAY